MQIKNSEIKSLSVEELQSTISDKEKAFKRLKFAHAISPIENPMQIRFARKELARLKTELTSKTK